MIRKTAVKAAVPRRRAKPVIADNAIAATPPSVTPAYPNPPLPLTEKLKAIIKAAADKKAEDPVVLDVSTLSGYTDHILILTAMNAPHAQALSEFISKTMKESYQQYVHPESDQANTWILIDVGSFVIHVFQPNARRHYGLEDLWMEAARIDLSGVI